MGGEGPNQGRHDDTHSIPAACLEGGPEPSATNPDHTSGFLLVSGLS